MPLDRPVAAFGLKVPGGSSKRLVVQLLVSAGSRSLEAGKMLRAAVSRGDLSLVQFLWERRPEYRLDGMDLAAAGEGGCEATGMLEWLVEQRPGGRAVGVDGTWPYIAAGSNGGRGTVERLQRLGVRWGQQDSVGWGLSTGCGVPVLRWRAAQGPPLGSDEVKGEKAASAQMQWGSGRRTRGGCGAWRQQPSGRRTEGEKKASGEAQAAVMGGGRAAPHHAPLAAPACVV